MTHLKTLLLMGVAIITCQAQADAQDTFESLDPFTTTYSVQVRKEHWNNGLVAWETVLTTEDYEEATMMLELLELALEEKMIHSILGGSSDYLITDVRLVTETTFDYYLDREPLVLRDYSYITSQSKKTTKTLSTR